MAGCGSRCNTARSRRHESGCRGTYAQYVALGKRAACNLYCDVKRRQAIRQRTGIMIDRRGPGAPGNRSIASRSRNWRKRAACTQGRRERRSTRLRWTDVGRRLTPDRVKLRRMLTWTPHPTPNPRTLRRFGFDQPLCDPIPRAASQGTEKADREDRGDGGHV